VAVGGGEWETVVRKPGERGVGEGGGLSAFVLDLKNPRGAMDDRRFPPPDLDDEEKSDDRLVIQNECEGVQRKPENRPFVSLKSLFRGISSYGS
jgi:hypothetical protein